jgi:uncharacterized protein (TIGR03437 family)
MRLTGILVCAITLCAGLAAAKPQISARGVRSAGSVADRKIARGSAFHVWGKALGPAEAVKAEAPYGVELGGVTIAFASGETVIQAFVVEAGAERITGILPSSTPPGEYQVTVTSGGETSEKFKVQVVDRNLGFVTAEAVAGGFASGRIKAPDVDPVAIGLVSPVRPGQPIELDAAGLGPIETPDNEFPPEANVVEGAVLVLNGALEVPVTYLGRNPQRPGYDLVRATLPAEGLPSGCGVTMRLKFGDVTTGRVALPAANSEARACGNPLGLPVESLERMQTGGTITTGSANLTQQAIDLGIVLPPIPGFPPLPASVKSETFDAGFDRHTLASFSSFFADGTTQITLNRNGCTVFEGEGAGAAFEVDATPLDAGAELTLTGLGNLDTKVKRDANSGRYSLQLTSPGAGFPPSPGGGQDKIVKGAYKLSGPGGADVGPFEATATVTDTITWTNKDDIKEVDRGVELKFAWTGGAAADLTYALGLASGKAPEDGAKDVTRGFICVAAGDAGGITVPVEILQKMPQTSGEDIDKLGMLTLQYTSAWDAGKFKAPLTAGGELEFGFFTWSMGSTKPGVPFK